MANTPTELQYLGRWCPRILSGRDHPYRQDNHAPTQLLPKQFIAQVVQEYLQSGATISSAGIHHGINDNFIRKWLPIYQHQSPATLPAFVPVKAVPRRAREEIVII